MLKHMRDQFKINVMALEYPGYGLLSRMGPTEKLVNEVSLTVFRYLVDVVGVRYSQIVLCGRSLGSGPAVHLASKYPVSGLILVSPFSSIKGAVKSIAGSLAALGFLECFPNDRVISNVSCPTLFIHGERDELIPMEHSVRLFKRCRARKLLVAPPNMEHNSNLFGDASFMAVPVIHFFGFPGYYTDRPPHLPSHIFEMPVVVVPEKPPQPQQAQLDKANQHSQIDTWFCGGCLSNKDLHHVDVPLHHRPCKENREKLAVGFKPNEVPLHESTDEDLALDLDIEIEAASSGSTANSGGDARAGTDIIGDAREPRAGTDIIEGTASTEAEEKKASPLMQADKCERKMLAV
jgi:hypothetical protein